MAGTVPGKQHSHSAAELLELLLESLLELLLDELDSSNDELLSTFDDPLSEDDDDDAAPSELLDPLMLFESLELSELHGVGTQQRPGLVVAMIFLLATVGMILHAGEAASPFIGECFRRARAIVTRRHAISRSVFEPRDIFHCNGADAPALSSWPEN